MKKQRSLPLESFKRNTLSHVLLYSIVKQERRSTSIQPNRTRQHKKDKV